MANTPIRTFRDLTTWQSAYKLTLEIYRVTKTFPDDERFGITNQLRRAAVSVSSNIAEGFSRRGSKENVQFYHMAKGSLTEVESQLLVANGVGYLGSDSLAELDSIIGTTGKQLTALIKKVPPN